MATPLTEMSRALGAGWQCLATPSGLNRPGFVYRLDPNGVLWSVADFSSSFSVKAVPAALQNISSSTSSSLGAIASLLNIAGLLAPATISGQGTTDYSMRVVVGSVTLESTMDSDPERDAVRSWFAGFPKESGSKYYLVRDAYVTKELAFELADATRAALSADAGYRGLVDGHVNLERLSTTAQGLIRSFDEPIRICIKPERLVVSGAGLGGSISDVGVQLRQVTSDLEVRAVR